MENPYQKIINKAQEEFKTELLGYLKTSKLFSEQPDVKENQMTLKDVTTERANMHKIKGSAAMLGLTDIAELAKKIESKILETDAERLALTLVDRCADDIKELADVISSHVDKL